MLPSFPSSPSVASSTINGAVPLSVPGAAQTSAIRILPTFLGTAVISTFIAVFLSAIGVGAAGRSFADVLPHNLVWSYCIGMSACTMATLAVRVNLTGLRRVAAVVAAVVAGTVVGVVLAQQLLGIQLDYSSDKMSPWQPLFIGLFFGGIASAFFWLREHNAHLAADIEAREGARIEAERRLLEAQLKMLQAQIEPHFLFNTLANVSSLIQRDPSLAATLLDALIRYLRASLVRTRSDGGTLGDEIELLRAYLEILHIRMGNRLVFEFDVADDLLAHPFPPMLLQPLVENAIRHGLECKIEGGRVQVSAMRKGSTLVVSVRDDGVGLQASNQNAASRPANSIASTGGVGLANIRARLRALFGEGGHLVLQPGVGVTEGNPSGTGMTAVVTVPLDGRA